MFLVTCRGTDVADESTVERQSFYSPGLPNFQLQVLPRSGIKSGVDLTISIPYSSVVFTRTPSGYSAALSIEVQMTDPVTRQLRSERVLAETVDVVMYEQTQTLDRHHVECYLDLSPGTYAAQVILRDINTDKQAVRRRRFVVHDTIIDEPTIGEMRILVRHPDGKENPFMGLHLPASDDSIVCSFRVYNLRSDDTLRSQLTVVRLESDSSLSSPPYAFAALRGSLEYTGLSDVVKDTITVVERRLPGSPGGNDVDSHISLRGTGVYTIVAEAEVISAASGDIRALPAVHRSIVVMPPGFPRPSTLNDLVEAITYIGLESEMEKLRKSATPDERRRIFESFWLMLGGNEQAAANLIRQYYTRVEEANLYFSSVKEGWRTDRGMLYIVLGPPVSVYSGIEGEQWRYTTVEQDIVNTYSFRRVQLPDEYAVFEQYVLERQPYHDQPWIAAVGRWRRGAGF